MPSAGFEPTILASERPQTHALIRAVFGIGQTTSYTQDNSEMNSALILIFEANIILRWKNYAHVPSYGTQDIIDVQWCEYAVL